MSFRGEKILVVEIMLTEMIVVVRELKGGHVPRPSQFIATLVLFSVLGGIAALDTGAADIAAALGAVILLTTMLKDSETVLSLIGIGASAEPAKVLPFKTKSGVDPSAPNVQA